MGIRRVSYTGTKYIIPYGIFVDIMALLCCVGQLLSLTTPDQPQQFCLGRSSFGGLIIDAAGSATKTYRGRSREGPQSQRTSQIT